MTYKFSIQSDDPDTFFREILIDADATFEDFRKAIINAVKYKDTEMTSFFICAEDWERGTEVTSMDMGAGSEYDTWLMSETKLSELVEEEGEKLQFVFDYMTDRAFYIELKEVSPSLQSPTPKCILSKGNPPKQEVDFDDYIDKTTPALDLDSDFYGDAQYNEDDIDEEGFDIRDSNGEPTEGNDYF